MKRSTFITILVFVGHLGMEEQHGKSSPLSQHLFGEDLHRSFHADASREGKTLDEYRKKFAKRRGD
ncbi:MAG: hypothetical protein E7773_00010 [Sphingomonas sp.]|uniref:hypothetical protein n=1 Tax=Sphingomonas sp. TaxID=28214 RepID=UPI001226A466|nr:hypothetical protein [Sphingomonas sp.]THD38182.1 MAG: hypothetical protein E7773_00010 [Sphingomonas sp.]